jgi:threonine dehydratase
MEKEPTYKDLLKAQERISPWVHRTPVFTSLSLDEMCGASLFFKCENLQKCGAFKIRGASNAVLSLSEKEAEKGVATHSSGNHAAALALAARWKGIPAYVVMPENAPGVKREAVKGYGAEISFCKPTLQAREKGLSRVLSQTGAAFIHPYNDGRVIAGQGTAALELIEDIPDLDVIMAPVGGGGLLSGTAIAVTSKLRGAYVVGAEPEEADDAFRSLKAGRIIPADNPQTVADGLRTSLGDLTFPIIQRLVKDIVTVSESGIVHGMRTLWERMKLVVEPSAAVPLGALLTGHINLEGKKVGILLSGGNVDLEKLPWTP